MDDTKWEPIYIRAELSPNHNFLAVGRSFDPQTKVNTYAVLINLQLMSEDLRQRIQNEIVFIPKV